jgi:hypothetical protein
MRNRLVTLLFLAVERGKRSGDLGRHQRMCELGEQGGMRFLVLKFECAAQSFDVV